MTPKDAERLIIFSETYSGESLPDLYRHVDEAIDPTVNEKMQAIGFDEWGFSKGTFTVVISWEPDSNE